MFGFQRSECPQVQLYGKLPLAKDYLRLGFGEGSGLALRKWLDETFSGAASSNGAPELAWPARFVAGKAWGGSMQGLVWPSSDAGGLRPFPFMLGVERRRKTLIEEAARAFERAQAVWNELRACYETCKQQPDGRAALAALRGSRIDVDSLAEAPAAGVALEPWLDGLWPGAGRDGLRAELGTLRQLLGGDRRAPLRVPLVPGLGYRRQVQAWLGIAAQLALIDGRACPTVFFPQPASGECEPQPFLTVFRGAPRPADGAWLAVPRVDDCLGVADLVGGRPPVERVHRVEAENVPPLSASLRATVSRYLSELDCDDTAR